MKKNRHRLLQLWSTEGLLTTDKTFGVVHGIQIWYTDHNTSMPLTLDIFL